MHRHPAGGDLPLQGLVRPEQQLLPGLPPGVERARHLRPAERPGVQRPAVLAGERHALRHRLVDDVDTQLGQPVHVGLAGAEVAALDRVVEQPPHAVAVARVVLGRVDAALGRHAVRPPRAVLVAERLDLVAQLTEGRRGRPAGQAGPDHDDPQPAPVGGADQPQRRAVPLPGGLDGSVGHLAVDHRTSPVCTASGTLRKPAVTTRAVTVANRWGRTRPRLRAALHSPCRRCRPAASTATV